VPAGLAPGRDFSFESIAEPIGRKPIHPGDDPTVIARRILREKSGKHLSFYQPLKYPPLAQIRSQVALAAAGPVFRVE
jgi:hypothetical protein